MSYTKKNQTFSLNIKFHFLFLWCIYKRNLEYNAIVSIPESISDNWLNLKIILTVINGVTKNYLNCIWISYKKELLISEVGRISSLNKSWFVSENLQQKFVIFKNKLVLLKMLY